MKRSIKTALFGGAIFAAGIAQADGTYIIYGPSAAASSNSGGYNWENGSATQDFRAALDSPYNFGKFEHYDTVDTRIITREFGSVNLSLYHAADCIISPWWWDNDVANSAGSFAAYRISYLFQHGTDLILLSDSPYADAIGEYLGVPTQYGGTTVAISGTSFPFDGPFGTAASPNLAYSVGYLNPVDITNTGGEVLATDTLGRPVVAFWEQDAFSPGSGKMLIVTDVNSFTTAADYGAMNDNAKFALNCVAFILAENTKPGGADCDKNGVLNIDDIDCFVDSFLNGEL